MASQSLLSAYLAEAKFTMLPLLHTSEQVASWNSQQRLFHRAVLYLARFQSRKHSEVSFESLSTFCTSCVLFHTESWTQVSLDKLADQQPRDKDALICQVVLILEYLTESNSLDDVLRKHKIFFGFLYCSLLIPFYRPGQ